MSPEICPFLKSGQFSRRHNVQKSSLLDLYPSHTFPQVGMVDTAILASWEASTSLNRVSMDLTIVEIMSAEKCP